MQWTLLFCIFASSAISASYAGIVENSHACPNAGSGTFVSMTLVNHDPTEPDCTLAPCHLKTENSSASYDVALEYIAREPASLLLFEIWFLRPNGGVTPLVSKNLEQLLEQGTTYVNSDTFTIPARFNNNAGDLSVFIKNIETDTRVICGEFPVFVSDDAVSKETLLKSSSIPRTHHRQF